MGAYQEILETTTDGTVGNIDAAVPIDDGSLLNSAQIVSSFLREPADLGLADRLAISSYEVPNEYRIQPPAKVGGLDLWSVCRSNHSIFNLSISDAVPLEGLINWQVVVPSVAGGGIASLDISILGYTDVPQIVGATLKTRPVAAVNWAITAIAPGQIDFKNWHATEDITLIVVTAKPHSHEIPIATAGPFDMTLNGVGEVTQAHGLAVTPDVVFGFPYSAGGAVEPAGIPIMTTLPDGINLYFGNAGAGVMVFRAYCQRTHSIQV